PPRYDFGFDGNCACYCKDTHFEAIHNHQTDDFVSLNSCFDFWSVLPAALQIYSWLSVECVAGFQLNA
ncbi:hypothetical protein, partial [Prevotella denticola]|uniref:hypothetical protein n=1 Tax=Prevotella denticola TaxID=28129 RepID=UPI001BA724B4